MPTATSLSFLRPIKEALLQLDEPIFHINRPSLFMLGVERYIPNFYSIQPHSSWGVSGEQLFVPSSPPPAALNHPETANWLLQNQEVQQFIADHTPNGVTPKVVFFLHNRTTETLCKALGYEILNPSVALREKLDSKLFTTELSESCGLQNVPHIILTASSPANLLDQAINAGLGTEIVLQRDYGEGGQGTYFASNEADLEAIGAEIIGIPLKVMKRITHRSLAVEAVIVSDGVILGPILQEIVGHAEVAVHPGSSSGLEFHPNILNVQQRQIVYDTVRKYGERLAELGYLGVFEVDLLQDLDTGVIYFGESNPRFSGCAMVTNSVTEEVWGLPLYALHIYAWLPQYPIQIKALNDIWFSVDPGHEWANLLIRHTKPTTEIIVDPPSTGRYNVQTTGELSFVAHDSDWFTISSNSEMFFLSYRKPGDRRNFGDDIGALFLRGTFQTDDLKLKPEHRSIVTAIQARYSVRKLTLTGRVRRALAQKIRSLRS